MNMRLPLSALPMVALSLAALHSVPARGADTL